MNIMMNKSPVWWKWFPWTLGILVVGFGKVAWLQSSGGTLWPKTLYDLFPILGIWAWSIMWTHFIVGEVRRLYPILEKNILYSKVSSIAVLVFLLLHPGLLAIAQDQQGLGKPPQSFYSYAGKGNEWTIVLGSTALFAFLGFEILEKLKKFQRIQKIWWIVNITQTVAMIFVFIHALELGQHLQAGWFRMYWIVLGLLLAPCLIHTHWSDLRSKK